MIFLQCAATANTVVGGQIFHLKEIARMQFEQVSGFIADLNLECDPDSPPLDEQLVRQPLLS